MCNNMPGDSGFAGLGNNNHHSSATRRRIPSDSSELQATGDSGAMATATTVESPRAGAGTGAGAGAMVAAPCVAAGPMAQAGAIKTSATAATTAQAPAGGAKARRAPSVAVAEIASALTSSAFLQSVAAARRDIMHSSRALTGDEVAALAAAGNTCALLWWVAHLAYGAQWTGAPSLRRSLTAVPCCRPRFIVLQPLTRALVTSVCKAARSVLPTCADARSTAKSCLVRQTASALQPPPCPLRMLTP